MCIILVFVVTLTGCGNIDKEDDNAFKAQITFNGSSTLAPVMSAIATDFIEEYTTWNNVDPASEENIAIYVSAGGSGAESRLF